MGWRPYVRTWINRLPKEFPVSGRDHLLALFEHTMDRCVGFVDKYAKHLTMPTPMMSMIHTMCNLLAAYFDFMVNHGGFGNAGDFVNTCDIDFHGVFL